MSPAIGQPLESDAVFGVGAAKSRGIDQVSESDTGLAMSRQKTKTVAQVIKADTALAVASQKTKPIAQAIETNTVSAITPRKARTLTQAIEADSVFAVSVGKLRILGSTIETDASFPMAIEGVISVTEEFDTATPLGAAKGWTLGQLSETDSVQSFGRLKLRLVSTAIESDISWPIITPVNLPPLHGASIATKHRPRIDRLHGTGRPEKLNPELSEKPSTRTSFHT